MSCKTVDDDYRSADNYLNMLTVSPGSANDFSTTGPPCHKSPWLSKLELYITEMNQRQRQRTPAEHEYEQACTQLLRACREIDEMDFHLNNTNAPTTTVHTSHALRMDAEISRRRREHNVHARVLYPFTECARSGEKTTATPPSAQLQTMLTTAYDNSSGNEWRQCNTADGVMAKSRSFSDVLFDTSGECGGDARGEDGTKALDLSRITEVDSSGASSRDDSCSIASAHTHEHRAMMVQKITPLYQQVGSGKPNAVRRFWLRDNTMTRSHSAHEMHNS